MVTRDVSEAPYGYRLQSPPPPPPTPKKKKQTTDNLPPPPPPPKKKNPTTNNTHAHTHTQILDLFNLITLINELIKWDNELINCF